MRIELSESEVKLVELIGKTRQEYNDSQGLKDEKQDVARDSTEMHIEGVAGEWAFCKAFNIYPDHDMFERGQHDCRTKHGTWDVKTVARDDDSLVIRLVKARRNKKVDYYALVIGSRPEYEIFGYIEAGSVFQAENVTNVGYGDFYLIPQRKLKRFKTRMV